MDKEDNTPNGCDDATLARDREIVAEGFWPKFGRVAGKLPYAEDLLAAFFAATDKETPRLVQATLLAALAYFVVPTDLIPDIVGVLGFTDDGAVLALAIQSVSAQIKPGHRNKARDLLRKEGASPSEPGSNEEG